MCLNEVERVCTDKRTHTSLNGFCNATQNHAAAEAVMRVHVLPLDVHMSIGVSPHWSSSKHVVRLESSQNTSVLAEIPCVTVRSIDDLRLHALTSKRSRWH